MRLHRYAPLRRLVSFMGTLAVAAALSLSLSACADETEVDDGFETDTTMFDTPMYDTTAFDTTMTDTLFDDTTGMGM